jgi:hypothetical protein
MNLISVYDCFFMIHLASLQQWRYFLLYRTSKLKKSCIIKADKRYTYVICYLEHSLTFANTHSQHFHFAKNL